MNLNVIFSERTLSVFTRFLYPLLFSLVIGFWQKAYADQRSDKDFFELKKIVGRGTQWIQNIPEKPVEEVSMVVRKQSGGNDVFINLRFGRDGGTFENGKRVYLRDTQTQSVRWDVGGALPGGKPLVLNAYNGDVFVESVIIRYRSSAPIPGEPAPPPRPNQPPPYRDDRGGYYHPRDNLNGPRHDHGSHNYDNDGYDPRNDGSNYGQQNPDTAARCRYGRFRQPRIEVGRIKQTGGLFSEKHKVEGSIYGACIEEAGYYEYGRLKQKINIPYNDRFQRQEFEVIVRSGRNGEIKIYTTDGAEDSVLIDDAVNQGNQDSLF